MWYTIFFQYILTWKSLIQNNEKLRYWIWTNFGQNSWNLPTKYRPHHQSPHVWMPILCAKKIRGSPSETDSIKSFCSMIPQQEYGSTRIHQKMLWFMVATGDDSIQHQPVPNSSSFHENTSRIHLKIQKNQKKIQKPPFVRTKNEWLAIPRGPQFKGPSICSAQPTPGRSKPSDPGEVLSSAVPLA